MEMIYDIESTDIKASYTASRVLWALLNTIFADDEDDALSFSDKELLMDILRYGTIVEVSKLKGLSCDTVRKHLNQVLERLNMKLEWLKENGPEIILERAHAMMQVEACQQTIKRQELDLIEAKANIHQLKTQLMLAQRKLERRDDNKAKRMEQIESLKKELLNAEKTIMDLRYVNGKLRTSVDEYKGRLKKIGENKAKEILDQIQKAKEDKVKMHEAKMAKAKKQKEKAVQLAQARASLKCASIKEQALLRKITQLENLVEWYKRARFNSELPEPSEP